MEKKFTPSVKAILIESPANPLLTITDIASVAAVAKRYGALTIIDNTFMMPYLQRPLALGADIVLHSATKYLGGHSDLVAGLAVVKNSTLAEKLVFLQKYPAIKSILADPVGSTMGGGQHGDCSIEEIGNDFIAELVHLPELLQQKTL